MFLINQQIQPQETKSVRVLIGVPSNLNDTLKDLAKYNGVTLNYLYRHIVSEALKSNSDTTGWDKLPYHTPSKPIQLTMPAWLKTSIQDRAKSLNLSMSELVREILKQYLKENSH